MLLKLGKMLFSAIYKGKYFEGRNKMRYQIYAFNENNQLNHAGTANFRGNVTKQKLMKHEKKWVIWRNNYIKENKIGDYPLKHTIKPSVLYNIHPIDQPNNITAICIV
jgi:hypothetical protein